MFVKIMRYILRCIMSLCPVCGGLTWNEKNIVKCVSEHCGYTWEDSMIENIRRME